MEVLYSLIMLMTKSDEMEKINTKRGNSEKVKKSPLEASAYV